MNPHDWRLYLVAPATIRAGGIRDLVPELAAAGVDAIQLREKEMEAGDLVRVAEPILAACRGVGLPFILNDRPDVAAVIAADGVHVGRNDLPVGDARRIVRSGIVGTSTHSESDIAAALAEAPDYVAVGPLFETPTKPGRPAIGLGLVRHAAATIDIPWFAIGGIEETNLDDVLDAGAERIVVVRAIADADDPVSAIDALRAKLDRAHI